MCIKDPVRKDIDKCIEQCHTAGIKVFMITGDSKETASAIAKEIGIINEHDDPKKSVFTGEQFEKMSEAERKQALSGDSGKVFSRVEP